MRAPDRLKKPIGPRTPGLIPHAAVPSLPARARPLPLTPAQAYEELFYDVQMSGLFSDSKTFVDAIAHRSSDEILEDYRRLRLVPGFRLDQFVAENFTIPAPSEYVYRSRPGEDVRKHIERLWNVLTRHSPVQPAHSSLLALPRPYVAPGGRFNEIYYWDSYFVMLGLKECGKVELMRDICENYAHMLKEYGLIPNGNRTYYLSRSQPPLFATMIELLATIDGPAVFTRYRDALRREYAFWMDGAVALAPGEAYRRVVRLPDGTLLNRHWDDRPAPRDEAYREDVETAHRSSRPAEEVYRHLRAGAESGWDFSSRWCADPMDLSTIETTDLAPVDLNCMLYQLECTLARAYEAYPICARRHRQAARLRREAIKTHLWSPTLKAFTDLNWRTGARTERLSAATVAPLFYSIATRKQAAVTAETVRTHLLAPHGMLTTTIRSGQQWDAPNGWAPLQWMAVEGLSRYNHLGLASTIARRWMGQNLAVFRRSGKLVEKYDITHENAAAGGGEYPLQDGFGWTNGVLRALLAKYQCAECEHVVVV